MKAKVTKGSMGTQALNHIYIYNIHLYNTGDGGQKMHENLRDVQMNK